MVYCCVPLCTNGYKYKSKIPGLKFHRFPANEKECNKWIEQIRRKDFVWSMNSVICSWHFPNGRQEGPTRFHWNEKKNFKLNASELDNGKPKSKNPIKSELIFTTKDTSASASNNAEQQDYAARIQYLEETLSQKCEEIKNLKDELLESSRKVLSLGVDIDILKYENHKLSDRVNFYRKFESETKELKSQVSNLDNLHRHSVEKSNDIFTSNIQEWDYNLVSSFTGFQSLSSIKFLIEAFKVHGINYKHNVLCLSTQNQIILFLMKLRLDLSNNVLGKLFSVSPSTVSRIFETLLNASYEFFYEGEGPLVNMPTREKTAQSLPKCFISEMKNCRIVIDCTEFEMEIPKLMNQKKLTYSSYKSRYTMKSLVGCAPNGVPIFVSDLYGGSLSDKCIVSASGLLGKLESGDLILADKGFEIHDILPPGVALNIPCFLTKNQFTLNETIQNRSVARARIIIERLNARFKIFKILRCIKASSRSKANRLVKVCVALTTLMPTLMDELNEML